MKHQYAVFRLTRKLPNADTIILLSANVPQSDKRETIIVAIRNIGDQQKNLYWYVTILKQYKFFGNAIIIITVFFI